MKHGETYVTEERAREREAHAFAAGYTRRGIHTHEGRVMLADDAASEWLRRQDVLQELSDLGQEVDKG